jgi:hypothetical protein
VTFVADKAALGQIFLWVLQSFITIIPFMIHTYFIHLPMNIIFVIDGAGEMHTHKL